MNEDLKAYVDGELGPLKRWLLSRKIAADPQLQAEVAALRGLSSELQSLREAVPLSDALRDRLLATAPAPTPALPRRLALGPTLGVTGGLVAASVAALVLLRPAPPEAAPMQKTEAAAPASVALSEPPERTANGASDIAKASPEDDATLGAGTAAHSVVQERFAAAPPALADAAKLGEETRARKSKDIADVSVLVGVARTDEAALRGRIERRLTEQGGVRVSREGEVLTFQVPRAKVISLRDEILRQEGTREKTAGNLLRIVLRPVD